MNNSFESMWKEIVIVGHDKLPSQYQPGGTEN
jgi:hypothetical protein